MYKQKKLLVNLLSYFLLFNIVHSQFALSLIKDNSLKLKFDSIDNKNNRILSQQSFHDGFFNYGQLKPTQTTNLSILKYNVGKKNYISIDTKHEAIFEDMRIKAEYCLSETGNIHNPMNMSYITITHKDKLMFKGWLFSRSSAISLPSVNGYFFFLKNCS